ncbi:hypothetical protein ACFQRL_10700 [Microbacterium fluvii]|uniref:Uncharacterized protein n=1 Tax=Microbacterium fluvii TaxID=415215 RepID=A0ABW2HE79_9MICO|nr:hypothetical protein [Microbacterium fluvii]MCU4673062.1 hypothetical protein [Microbacterium fluvii]
MTDVAKLTLVDLERVAQRLHGDFPGRLQTEAGSIAGSVLYLDVAPAGAPPERGVVVIIDDEVSINDPGGFRHSIDLDRGDPATALIEALRRIVAYGHIAAKRFGFTVSLIAGENDDPAVARLRARSRQLRSLSDGWLTPEPD